MGVIALVAIVLFAPGFILNMLGKDDWADQVYAWTILLFCLTGLLIAVTYLVFY